MIDVRRIFNKSTSISYKIKPIDTSYSVKITTKINVKDFDPSRRMILHPNAKPDYKKTKQKVTREEKREAIHRGMRAKGCIVPHRIWRAGG